MVLQAPGVDFIFLNEEENFFPPTGIYEISHFDEPHNFWNFCHQALVLQVHKSIYSFSSHMNFLYHASFAWKNTCDTCVQNLIIANSMSHCVHLD